MSDTPLAAQGRAGDAAIAAPLLAERARSLSRLLKFELQFRADAPFPATARDVTYDRQLAFTGFSLPESTVAAGGVLPVETHWRRAAAADRQFMIQLVLRDTEGKAVFSVVRHLGYLLYPVAEWPADTPVRETYRLVVPSHIRPGAYSLGLRAAWWRDGPLALCEPDDPRLREQGLIVPLGRITVTGPRAR